MYILYGRYLNGKQTQTVRIFQIFGVIFEDDSSGSQTSSVDKLAEKRRRYFYSLRDIGMSYPDLSSDVNTYIWSTMGQPILLCGLDCIPLSRTALHKLESTQRNLPNQ